MSLDDTPSSIFRNSSPGHSTLIPVPGGAPPSPAPPPLLSAGALLKALARCWLVAFTIGPAAAAAAAAAVWLGMPPPKDTVRASLHVSATTPSFLNPNGETRGTNYLTYQRTQMTLLKSRIVLNAALRQVGNLDLVREQLDPVQWLDKEIKTDFAAGAEVLRVSMATDRPEEAKAVVNAVTKAYLEEIVNKDHKKRTDQLETIRRIAKNYEVSLQRTKQSLQQTAETVGTTDAHTVALKQRFAQEQLAMAQKELLQTQSELRHLRVEQLAQGTGEPWRAAVAALWGQAGTASLGSLPWGSLALAAPGDLGDDDFAPDPTLVTTLVDQQLAADATAQGLLAARAQAEETLSHARRIALRGDDDLAVRRARQELDAVRTRIEARRTTLRPAVEKQLRDRARADRRALAGITSRRMTLLSQLEKTLDEEVKRLARETQSLGRGAVNIENYKQEIAEKEKMAGDLARQVEHLTVELEAPARVTPLEDAVVVSVDGKQRRLMTAAGAGGATLFVVLFVLAWREFRKRRVVSVAEVTEGLRLNVVGTLPLVPAGRGRWLAWAEEGWRDRLAESVDATRTMLLHASTKTPIQIVMVTSAVGGEGKTSLSGHLAASLARSGRETLLIDCDLRHPAAHRLFGLASLPGLSEVLRGEAAVADALLATHTPGLTLLPAGVLDARVMRALANEDLKHLFTQLRRHYEFIIVDSSPVLPVTDSLLVAPRVDAVVFSVMRGISQMPQVQAAAEKLAMLDVPVLGAVVSGTRETVRRYAYGPVAATATPPTEETPCEDSRPSL